MKRIVAICAAAVALTACSSGASPVTARPTSHPANPVTVLRLTGCPVPPAEVNGTLGTDSDRVADCTYPGEFGETVWVFTYPTVAYRDNRIAHPLAPPQDGSYTIRGPGASLVTVDRPGGFTGPSPQRIARKVGGTLIVPG